MSAPHQHNLLIVKKTLSLPAAAMGRTVREWIDQRDDRLILEALAHPKCTAKQAAAITVATQRALTDVIRSRLTHQQGLQASLWGASDADREVELIGLFAKAIEQPKTREAAGLFDAQVVCGALGVMQSYGWPKSSPNMSAAPVAEAVRSLSQAVSSTNKGLSKTHQEWMMMCHFLLQAALGGGDKPHGGIGPGQKIAMDVATVFYQQISNALDHSGGSAAAVMDDFLDMLDEVIDHRAQLWAIFDESCPGLIDKMLVRWKETDSLDVKNVSTLVGWFDEGRGSAKDVSAWMDLINQLREDHYVDITALKTSLACRSTQDALTSEVGPGSGGLKSIKKM